MEKKLDGRGWRRSGRRWRLPQEGRRRADSGNLSSALSAVHARVKDGVVDLCAGRIE
ncbi:hypothetical protein YC2023_062636 [Brassica napus]